MSTEELRSSVVMEESGDDFDSEEDRVDQEARIRRKHLRNLKEEKNKQQNTKTMVVGTGFGFDLTDYFDFQKSDDCLAEISGTHIAWFIVLYAVCNSAMIPPWIMNIKANKYLRISWRFMMQSLMMIPFVLYEYRTGNQLIRSRYKFSYIFKRQHIKTLYITSFASSLWFTVVLTCFDWAYISHGMVLGGLNNLFLSLHSVLNSSRVDTRRTRQMQIGGQLLAFIGIFLVMGDSYTFDPNLQPDDCSKLINPLYIGREPWQRVASNLIALATSLILSFISRNNPDPKSYLPSYLSILITNSFVCINMSLSAFFFNGATFDMDPKFGVFSIFSQQHFTGFLYMSIILGLGLFLSSVMITRIFDQKLTPALAMIFQPVISTMFLRMAGVQCLPGTVATIGYVFIIPGMFLVIVGQNQLDKYVESRKKSEQAVQLQDFNKRLKEENDLLKSQNNDLTQSLLSNAVDRVLGVKAQLQR